MNKDLRQELPLETLAQSVNVSSSHLRCLFKAEIGVPPAHYLKLLRLHKAKQLAEDTFMNVKQIMDEVGVSDESHFVRDFKRTYGVTFRQYRSGCTNECFNKNDLENDS